MIVNNVIHEVSLSYALGISPFIADSYQKDPTLHELKITINCQDNKISDKEIQEGFCKFIKGGKISKDLFYEIGIVLENKEMIKKWSDSLEFSKETIIKSIKAYHQIITKKNNKYKDIENIKEELEYISEHLEEMKDIIKELNDEEVIYILKNDKIKVEKEDIIWEIVKEIITHKNRNENNFDKKDLINKSRLIGTIQVQYLNREYFQEYIKLIEENDIEREPKILHYIKDLLIKNINNIKLEENTVKIMHKEKPKATVARDEDDEDDDDEEEEELSAEGLDEGDILTIVEQGNVSRNRAIQALRETNGDVVNAVMRLVID